MVTQLSVTLPTSWQYIRPIVGILHSICYPTKPRTTAGWAAIILRDLLLLQATQQDRTRTAGARAEGGGGGAVVRGNVRGGGAETTAHRCEDLPLLPLYVLAREQPS